MPLNTDMPVNAALIAVRQIFIYGNDRVSVALVKVATLLKTNMQACDVSKLSFFLIILDIFLV